MVEFVKMRNAYAKNKGYDTYFDYMIDDSYEISPEKLDELLLGVYSKTKDISAKFDEERKEVIKKGDVKGKSEIGM